MFIAIPVTTKEGNMKTIISALVGFAILSSVIGCSDNPPGVRVANQRGTKANVQFKQANGNTININDMLAGTTSSFQDIAEGAVVVTAVIQTEAVAPVTTFNSSMDNNYTIVILAGDPPVLRVDTEGN